MRLLLTLRNGVAGACPVPTNMHVPKLPAKWLMMVCVIALSTSHTKAQTTLLYTINYVADRTTMYVYPDSLQSYLIHEQIALLPVYQRDSVIRMVYTNKDVKNITYYKADSRFEDWMTRPAKSIVDKKSVKLYNSSGMLMLTQTHSADYKALYSDLKTQMSTLGTDLIPDYVQLTNTLKSNLLANGFVMTNLGGGTYRFVKDSVEVRYNNSRKMNEMRLYHADGSLKYALLRDFAVNSFGQTTPVLTQERRPDTRFPGGCVEEVVTTKYPTYYMVYGGTGKIEEDDMAEDELYISPNPATTETTISYPPEQTDKATAMVEVFDLTGKMVIQKYVNASEGSVVINTSSLEAGVYAVIYTCALLKLESQFVKQ